MSRFFGNPEDRFSRVEAQIIIMQVSYLKIFQGLWLSTLIFVYSKGTFDTRRMMLFYH